MSNPLVFPQDFLDTRQFILQRHRQLILDMRLLESQIAEKSDASVDERRMLEAQRNDLYYQIEPLVEAYWAWIPLVPLAQCPFCSVPFKVAFDPFDLNGFWWMHRTQRPGPPPEACAHTRLLTGAVDFNGVPYEPPLFESDPGPQKPFVIPRLLRMPMMKAVIQPLQMVCGYIAFPTVYFSEENLEADVLTQSWARKDFIVKDVAGKKGWRVTEEDKDFDLTPWMNQKSLIYDHSSCSMVRIK